ncbi:7TM-DISM domain-containing protein [Methyloversatilis discipulorum]|uniref:sensor histidine kinase n=1 Tax=Methyloversatilis discipulorum TaxID=1119528 RepID=UPI003AF45801
MRAAVDASAAGRAALVTAVRVLVVALLLFLCPLRPALADDEGLNHVVSQAVQKHVAADQPLAAVIARPFTPFDGVLAGGYTRDTEWLRLVIRPRADGGPLVLRIQPAYLNELTLYAPDPAQPGGWRSEASGNRLPWSARPYPAVALGFTVQPQTETTYYLRLNTRSNSLLHVEALPADAAARADVRAALWQGLYLAVLSWIALWALREYWISRDRVIGAFALAQVIYVLYTLAVLGYLSPLLGSAGFIPELTFWLVTLAVMTSLLFHRALLRWYEATRWGLAGVHGLIAASVLAVLLLLAGQVSLALQINSLVALLAGPLLLGAALSARRRQQPGRLALNVCYTLLLLSLLGYIPPLLGWTRAAGWVLYGALVQGLIASILMGGLQHWRARLLARQASQAQHRLLLSEQQLALRSEQLVEQERFMTMLTHELKTPLASIRLSVDAMSAPHQDEADQRRRGRINRALANIDAIVERCALSARIEQRDPVIRSAPCELPALLADLVAGTLESARVELHIDAPLPALFSDAQLLGVAVGNLLDNALKYSPPDALVELRLVGASDERGVAGVRIAVLNLPGPSGLPDAEHAFLKYHRGERAGFRSGSGLGLHLVRGIAEHLGGQVHYALDAGRIRFSLWLPCTPR